MTDYFATLLNIDMQGGVEATRPNGEKAYVRYLVENNYGDSERILCLIEAACQTNNRTIPVEAANGTLIMGRFLAVNDIVGWAIEKGYLEELGEQLVIGT
jgi:hypothetical protein